MYCRTQGDKASNREHKTNIELGDSEQQCSLLGCFKKGINDAFMCLFCFNCRTLLHPMHVCMSKLVIYSFILI